MANDPAAVNPGDSTYSLRTPDSVSAADLPQTPMDRVLPRQTSTGLARGIQQLGSPNVYVDSGNEQIIVAKNSDANTSVPQVLMGNQVNKGEGFYVTKPGIDVTTAKNDSDFIFNSNQNVFKIVKKDTITFNIATTASDDYFAIDTYNHNLGFEPSYLAFVTPPANYTGVLENTNVPFFDYQYYDSFSAPPAPGWHIIGRIDVNQVTDTYIKFSLNFVYAGTSNSTYRGDWIVSFYLLQETFS